MSHPGTTRRQICLTTKRSTTVSGDEALFAVRSCKTMPIWSNAILSTTPFDKPGHGACENNIMILGVADLLNGDNIYGR